MGGWLFGASLFAAAAGVWYWDRVKSDEESRRLLLECYWIDDAAIIAGAIRAERRHRRRRSWADKLSLWLDWRR